MDISPKLWLYDVNPFRKTNMIGIFTIFEDVFPKTVYSSAILDYERVIGQMSERHL